MDGVVQEPFGRFQADSLHSGSISFGRFEVESLSWERRSSFSHNRYLEEVEKYARPGSVTEKKAYFEAHFRRKALLRLASSESQVESERSVNENGSDESGIYEESNSGEWSHTEEPDQHNGGNSDVCHFDASPDSSCYDGDSKEVDQEMSFSCDAHFESHMEPSSIVQTDIVTHLDHTEFEGGERKEEAKGTVHSELQLEPACDSVDQMENVVECYDNEETFKTKYEDGYVETDYLENDAEVEFKSNDQAQDVLKEASRSLSNEATGSVLETLQTNALELRATQKTRSSNTRSRYQDNASHTRKSQPMKEISQTAGRRETQIPSRTRTQKQMSKSIGSSLQSSLRISKKENPPSLKTKTPQEKRSDKELRQKRSVTLQPSTPERNETRGHLSVARTKHVAFADKEGKRCTMNSSFRSESGEKKREEKKGGEIRQVARNLNCNAKPMTSVYHDGVLRGSSGYKSRVVPNSRVSSKAPSKLSHLGNSMASGSTQCSRKGENQETSPSSKSRGSHVSLRRRNCNIDETLKAHGPSSSRNNIVTANQKKEVVYKKEEKKKETDGKTLRSTECVQVSKGRTTNARKKAPGMQRSSNPILRKTIGHSSAICHLTVSVTS